MAAQNSIAPDVRARVLAEAYEDLAKRRTVTLVTYPPGEEFPRLRGMGFVHDGWRIYMSTFKHWLKAKEIAAAPKVSVWFHDPERRRDHFLQIDGHAVVQTGADFDAWQELRYAKEGDNLRRAVAGAGPDKLVGWVFEPARVRALGYLNERPWSEAPVVFQRAELGLPPR